MGWWKNRTEKRAAAAPYTDAVIAAIQSAAGGEAARAETVGALETAAGFYARALAAAIVNPAHPAVTPALLSMCGRELIRRGEFVAAITMQGGRVDLIPAGAWDVSGGNANESSWVYRLDLFAPSGSVTRTIPAAGVVHIRYAVDPIHTWRGLSPLAVARATGRLSAELERALGDEAAGAVGHLLPVPADGGESALENLRAQLRALGGKTALVETTAAGWGDGRGAAPMGDWKPQRIGGNPPAAMVELRQAVYISTLSACGIPPALAALPADGSAQREAWRRFLHGGVAPLGRLIEAELSAKLETPIALKHDGLFASDLQGRARAFGSLVKAGMDGERAARLAGLDAGEASGAVT